MLKVSDLMKVSVFSPRRDSEGAPDKLPEKDLTLVGQVHQTVFSPKGDVAVGLLVRRPDVAGMIKREDAFLALDSFVVGRFGLVVSREDGLDEAAIVRLGLDWDRCVMWYGMDARTSDGKELGWVSDVEFSPKSGQVRAFYVDDGSVAKSLVGSVVIPGEMLVGYQDGFLVVEPGAAGLELNGGIAAKAGASYAKAKAGGREIAERVGETVEKGAYATGKAISKAKRSVKKKTGGKSVKKAAKDQLKATRGMFGSFMDEYRKASK